MRRAFRTTFVVGALAVAGLGSAAIASAAPTASSSALIKRCGTGQYEKPCTPPTVTFSAPSAMCKEAGTPFSVPTITFTSIAGLHQITVKLGGKVVKSISFPGDGPTQYVLRGLQIDTTGLSAGNQMVMITATDVGNRTTTSNTHFVICQPKPVATKPVFTG